MTPRKGSSVEEALFADGAADDEEAPSRKQARRHKPRVQDGAVVVDVTRRNQTRAINSVYSLQVMIVGFSSASGLRLGLPKSKSGSDVQFILKSKKSH
jgi:hypothetical protein